MLQQVTSFNRSTLQGGSGGSGLSLWICKNLAAIHGGRMVPTILLEKTLLGSILTNFRCRGSNRMVQGEEVHSLWTFQSTPPKKGPSLLWLMLLLSRCKWTALRVYLIRTFQSILEERRLMTMILEETATRSHPLCMHFECHKPRWPLPLSSKRGLLQLQGLRES